LLGGCVLAIVWPHGDLRFDTDSHDLLRKHLDRSDCTTTLLWNLIARMTKTQMRNSRRLRRIAFAFRAGTCLLAIQLVSTAVSASAIL